MSKLRDSSIQVGGTPAPLNKYTTNHGRQSKMPPMAPTPRDSGGMSDGQTGGNFDPKGMAAVPNGPGAAGTTPGADAAQAAFEENGQ